MKLRTSFVSNSSSSSFIITDKNNFDKVKEILKDIYGDYYEYDDILYTSRVSDCNDIYNEILELSSDSFDYNEYNYCEIEGERGVNTVYVPSEAISENNKVYQIVKKFMNENDVLEIICACGDKDLYDFFNELNKIISNTNDDLE